MGCDIHIITEIKKEGKWQYVTEIPEMFNRRDYDLFAILANVRNYSGFKSIEPKGLPNDLSAKKFAFESYSKRGKERYEGDGTIMFVSNNGEILSPSTLPDTLLTENEYNELTIKSKIDDKTFSIQYYGLGWRQSGNTPKEYYVKDAFYHNGIFKKVSYCKIYKTLEDFMKYYYDEDWDEDAQDYGRWDVDFTRLEEGDYHSASYYTLTELLNSDFSDYYSHRYKMSKHFYDSLIKSGGTLPENMTPKEYEPTEFSEIINYAFNPSIIISWPLTPEEIQKTNLYKGIEELKEIANKYSVNNTDDIRIVFAFDN